MIINEKLTFRTVDGLNLTGRLIKGVNPPRFFALFAPCFTCGKDVHLAKRLSEKLTYYDIATFALDFRGLGDSEGNFSESNFTTQVEDLTHAYEFIFEKFKQPHVIIGHSIGGTAAVVSAASIPELQAVVTINAPYEPAHLSRHFAILATNHNPNIPIEIKIGPRTFSLKSSFVDDLKKYNMNDILKVLKARLLIFHAQHDEIVSIENAYKLLSNALSPKGFISINSTNHMLSSYDDSDYLAGMISQWLISNINK